MRLADATNPTPDPPTHRARCARGTGGRVRRRHTHRRRPCVELRGGGDHTDVVGHGPVAADGCGARHLLQVGEPSTVRRPGDSTLRHPCADHRRSRESLHHRGQPLQRARRRRVRAVDRRDALVQLPVLRPGAALELQLRRYRRVRLVQQRLPVPVAARGRACADPAVAQLRRHQLAHDEHPRPADPEPLGQQPHDRHVQLRQLLAQGPGAVLDQARLQLGMHGQRQLGDVDDLLDDGDDRLSPDPRVLRADDRAGDDRRPLRRTRRGHRVPREPARAGAGRAGRRQDAARSRAATSTGPRAPAPTRCTARS